MLKCNSTEFIWCCITVNGTWIHHYMLEIMQQSKQWVDLAGSAQKKAKCVPSAEKIIATVFWCSWCAHSHIRCSWCGAHRLSINRQNNQMSVVQHFWSNWKILLMSNVYICLKKKCFSTRTMHLWTHVQLLLQNFMNGTSNYVAKQTLILQRKSYYTRGIKKLEKCWFKCTVFFLRPQNFEQISNTDWIYVYRQCEKEVIKNAPPESRSGI